MKNQSGITLVGLIITVAVLLIIASISVYNGIDSVNSVRLNGFYTQLEIVQEKVDDIASTNESYVDQDDNVIYIKEAGQDLSEEQKNKLRNILDANNINSSDIIDNFRYFTTQDIESILDLREITYNLFINFENKIIVAEEGITIEDTTYYMLKNAKKFVETNSNKNVGNIAELGYSNPIKYGEKTYKVIVTPSNKVGDLEENDGYIKYKKTTSKYWETTTNLEIILEFGRAYDIIYTDLNNNTIQETIQIEYKKDEEGNIVKDDDGNDMLVVRELTAEESEEI